MAQASSPASPHVEALGKLVQLIFGWARDHLPDGAGSIPVAGGDMASSVTHGLPSPSRSSDGHPPNQVGGPVWA